MQFLQPDFQNITNDNAAKVDWLCRLRIVAAIAQLAILPIGVINGLIAERDLSKIIAMTFLLILLNSIVWSFRKRVYTDYMVFSQVTIDFIFFALFLKFSSGFVNPLINLCFIHFAIAGLNLSAKYSYFFFLIATALLIFLFLKSFPDATNQRSLILLSTYVVIGLAILLITQWFSRTMARYKDSIYLLRQSLGKIDALRASGLVAANLCHELATPINHALLNIDFIRQSNDPNAKSQLCNELESLLLNCGTKLRGIFSDTSLEKDKKFVEEDIAELTILTARAWKNSLNTHIKLEFSIPDRKLIKSIPKILFVRTLMDFLDNAKDAIESKQGRIFVSVREIRDNKVEVIVEDDGPGFSINIIEQIGTPFLTTKADGVGLGLYTASHLALYLGGELKASNSSSGGAKISLFF